MLIMPGPVTFQGDSLLGTCLYFYLFIFFRDRGLTTLPRLVSNFWLQGILPPWLPILPHSISLEARYKVQLTLRGAELNPTFSKQDCQRICRCMFKTPHNVFDEILIIDRLADFMWTVRNWEGSNVLPYF